MIESAALLMREQGVDGTSFSRVVSHSAAPRGSIYHYFPGGKAQLVEEATRFAGDFIAAGLVAALEEDDPMAGLDATAAFWRSLLEQSEFAAGCPVVAASVEGNRTPQARDAAGEVFERWQSLLANGLRRHGASDDRAL